MTEYFTRLKSRKLKKGGLEGRKILIVANSTWNIYNFRLNVLRALQKEGCELIVAAPVDDYIFYQKRFPQIRHVHLDHLNRKGTNPLEDWKLIRQMIRLYQRERPDLILQYTIKPNIYGSFAARFCRIPAISVITGLGYSYIHNGYLFRLVEELYRWSLYHNPRVIFENQDDRLLFVEKGIIKPSQGVSVKGCGVNVEYFTPMAPSETNNGQLIFTFVGRLLYDKGLYEFIQTAQRIRRARSRVAFWVVGELDEGNPASVNKRELNQWIKSGVIEYKGFANDVRPIIAQSDCIVLPSYREAIARSLTEAMAMGKPVIATDTAGCREAVEHGKNGFLVPVKDADALADAVDCLIDLGEEARSDMGRYGREKTIREFDDHLIANQMVTFIRETLSEQNQLTSDCRNFS